MGSWGWASSPRELEALQDALARAAGRAQPWRPGSLEDVVAGGVFFASRTERAGRPPGEPGEPAWVGVVVARRGATLAEGVVRGETLAAYRSGYLALREGPLLEEAVRSLPRPPEVLLVNASGRDHPRRAGLTLHLGAVLDLPTIGVTDRPLLAVAREPGPDRGHATALRLGGELVGYAVRARRTSRPIVAHAAWRTDPEVAREVVLAVTGRARTPEPLRRARFLARVARARDEGRLPPGWRSA